MNQYQEYTISIPDVGPHSNLTLMLLTVGPTNPTGDVLFGLNTDPGKQSTLYSSRSSLGPNNRVHKFAGSSDRVGPGERPGRGDCADGARRLSLEGPTSILHALDRLLRTHGSTHIGLSHTLRHTQVVPSAQSCLILPQHSPLFDSSFITLKNAFPGIKVLSNYFSHDEFTFDTASSLLCSEHGSRFSLNCFSRYFRCFRLGNEFIDRLEITELIRLR
jgi:hypothetical protein